MIEDRITRLAPADPPVDPDRLVHEINNIMRERGMDSWLESVVVDIVRKAWRRVGEAKSR